MPSAWIMARHFPVVPARVIRSTTRLMTSLMMATMAAADTSLLLLLAVVTISTSRRMGCSLPANLGWWQATDVNKQQGLCRACAQTSFCTYSQPYLQQLGTTVRATPCVQHMSLCCTWRVSSNGCGWSGPRGLCYGQEQGDP